MRYGSLLTGLMPQRGQLEMVNTSENVAGPDLCRSLGVQWTILPCNSKGCKSAIVSSTIITSMKLL